MEDRYRQTLAFGQKIFTESVTYDLLTGADVEALKKCRKFFENPDVTALILTLDSGHSVCSLNRAGRDQNGIDLESPISFDPSGKEGLAKLRVTYSPGFRYAALAASALAIVVLFLVPLLISGYVLRVLRVRIVLALERLAQLISTADLDLLSNSEIMGTVDARSVREIRDLSQGIKTLACAVRSSRMQLVENAKQEALVHFAQQTAHDVKSPLAALRIATANLDDIPEDIRAVIRNAMSRVNEIMSALQLRSQQMVKDAVLESQVSHDCNQIDPQPILLSAVVDALVCEKQIQYRSHEGVKIRADIDKAAYGCFVRANIIELKRLLSNLVNNSVEALVEAKGSVVVRITPGVNDGSLGRVALSILDNGKGIPESVMKRIGARGNTCGKADGSGLGLYHAKNAVESWGGCFSVKTMPGVGTDISLGLISAEPPSWFMPTLTLSSETTVVILDDDPSIHEVWKTRLSKAGYQKAAVHLLDAEQLRHWAQTMSDSEAYLYLFDYQLRNGSQSGLDLIEKLHLRENAFLITGNFEDLSIRRRCTDGGIKLFPKSLVGILPLVVEETVHVV